MPSDLSHEVARIIAKTAAKSTEATVGTLDGLVNQLRQSVVTQDTKEIAQAISDALLTSLQGGLTGVTLATQEAPTVENTVEVEVHTDKMATAISDLFALDLRPDMSPLAAPFQTLSEALDRVADVGICQEQALKAQEAAMIRLSGSNMVLAQAVTAAAELLVSAIKAPVVVKRDATGQTTQLVKE